MQNNVIKRTLLAFACAILTAVSLFTAFCLPIESKEVYNVSDRSGSDSPSVSVADGVTYIGNGFTVTDYTESVERGKTATVTVNAPIGKEIDIRAYYASGKSSAKAFTSKISESGTVAWTWSVPKNSTTEQIRIVLRGADTYATLYIALI